MELIYKNEKQLFVLMLILSAVVWLALIVGTLGIALVYALLFFLGYCFAQSALISYIKGTGVKITDTQFPDLHRQIAACCDKLGLDTVPDAYLMQMGGTFNAFATRFLGRDFLVLYSDVVDALEDQPDALNFYIGHEIGHIKRKHLVWSPVLAPAAILPLVGAAYSRAREYTCDRHGLAACGNAESAQQGIAVLAAGGKRWRTMSHGGYIDQARETKGFWMSFHELVGDYPWLVKRMAAVRSLAAGQEPEQPSRSALAYVLALFVPRLGVGAGGGAAGLIVIVAIIGILAAVAIPAYQDYVDKSKTMAAYGAGQRATAAVEKFYYEQAAVPASLEEAGISERPGVPGAESISLDSKNGVVQVVTRTAGGQGTLSFEPTLDEKKRIVWSCTAEDIKPTLLPKECR